MDSPVALVEVLALGASLLGQPLHWTIKPIQRRGWPAPSNLPNRATVLEFKFLYYMTMHVVPVITAKRDRLSHGDFEFILLKLLR